jgi:hypothetical protein
MGIVIALAIILSVLIISVGASIPPQPTIPQQAQASHLAVPSPTYKFQSAIVIHSCRLLTGVIFADSKGNLHPVDPVMLKKLNMGQVLELLAQAPAANEISVETLCNKDGAKT